METIDRYTTPWAWRPTPAPGPRPPDDSAQLLDLPANYVLKGGFLLGEAGLHGLHAQHVLHHHQTPRRGPWRSSRNASRHEFLHVDSARGWRGGQNQVPADRRGHGRPWP